MLETGVVVSAKKERGKGPCYFTISLSLRVSSSGPWGPTGVHICSCPALTYLIWFNESTVPWLAHTPASSMLFRCVSLSGRPMFWGFFHWSQWKPKLIWLRKLIFNLSKPIRNATNPSPQSHTVWRAGPCTGLWRGRCSKLHTQVYLHFLHS